jgi:hypothetical protein
MKKFLIAVIIIIPVVVVFSLMLTGAVISATINVNAEKMIIHDINDKPLDETRTYTLPLEDGGKPGSMQIIIIILPAISYNSEIDYTFTEDSTGRVTLTKQEEKGRKYTIEAASPGEVGLVIYPKSNYNLKKVINIYITSNYIASFSIAANGQPVEGTYPLTDTTKFYANFYPAEAIGSNIITWKSSRPDIVSVDQNGVASIKGLGQTTISTAVVDMAERKHTAEIEVDTTRAVVKSSKIYLNSESNSEQWIKDNLVLQNGSAEITLVSSNQEKALYKVTYGELEQQVEVYNIPYNEWDIANREYFSYDEQDQAIVYIDNGGYFLSAAYLDFSNPATLNAVFSSSDESVLKVSESGVLLPVKQGVATVRATLSNGEYKEIVIKVTLRANTFLLNLTENFNKVGIKLERVWGYNFISGSLNKNEFTHSYQLFYHPGSATFRGTVIEDFRLFWEVANPEYASIDQNGVITFKEAACGKDVKVIATELVHNVKTQLSKSYTFRMLEDKEAVNVDEEDLVLSPSGYYNTINFLSNYLAAPIALHTDVDFTQDQTSNNSFAFLKNCFYGNGYTITAEKWVDRYDKQNGYEKIPGNEKGMARFTSIFLINTNVIKESLDKLIIENVSFKGTAIADNAEVRLEDFEARGMAMDIYADSDAFDKQIILRYNHIRYFGDGFRFVGDFDYEARYSYNLLVEGSIIGDCYRFPVHIDQRGHFPTSEAVFRNIVFKASTGPSIMIMPVSVSSNKITADYILNKFEKVEINVRIEGFIDNYNWKRLNQLDSVFVGLIDPEWLQGYETLQNLLDTYLKKEMARLLSMDKYSSLKYTDQDGTEWVNLMGFVSGMWNNLDPNTIYINGPSYEIMKMPMPTAQDGGIIGTLLPLFQTLFTLPETPGSSNKVSLRMDKPCYIVSYKFRKNTPEILPNQPCPNDEQLLIRLQGN